MILCRNVTDYECVALLAEGVDRNDLTVKISLKQYRVALLAEGVDRNSLSAPSA